MKVESNKLEWIRKEFLQLKKQGLLINIRTIESPMGPKIRVDGRWVLNFSSNNYLGLANHPRLIKAVKIAVNKYGVGPTAVRTIAGTTLLHKRLEKALADFKGTEDVITFQSGFNANIATIPTLVGENDIIFSDELNHASIIDGCRLSKATVIRYLHKDSKDLENKIKKAKGFGKKLIITDGVFSMDGDIANLSQLQVIAEKYNSLLMVDDAHGEGVLGSGGRGIVDHFNLHGKVDIEVGTLSKAFGVVGGFVAGKKIIVDWLRQRARPFLFSSAMTIPDVAACLEATSILKSSNSLVKKLWKNTTYFKQKLKSLGFDTGFSETPITPIMLGDSKLAKKFSAGLYKEGVFAVAVGFPTVPVGKARIRVMVSAIHSKKDLDKALSAFELVGKKLKVVS